MSYAGEIGPQRVGHVSNSLTGQPNGCHFVDSKSDCQRRVWLTRQRSRDVPKVGGSQGLLHKSRTFAEHPRIFLIFIFRAFSILHFTTYVDNACVAKTTKSVSFANCFPLTTHRGILRGKRLRPAHAGPRRFAAARTPAHAGAPARPKWVLKFVIKVVGLRKLLPMNLERSTRTIIARFLLPFVSQGLFHKSRTFA